MYFHTYIILWWTEGIYLFFSIQLFHINNFSTTHLQLPVSFLGDLPKYTERDSHLNWLCLWGMNWFVQMSDLLVNIFIHGKSLVSDWYLSFKIFIVINDFITMITHRPSLCRKLFYWNVTSWHLYIFHTKSNAGFTVLSIMASWITTCFYFLCSFIIDLRFSLGHLSVIWFQSWGHVRLGSRILHTQIWVWNSRAIVAGIGDDQ